jgi:hypothetical protein
VVDAARIERVGQRTAHVFLSDELVERAWAPLSGKNEVTHRRRQVRWRLVQWMQ